MLALLCEQEQGALRDNVASLERWFSIEACVRRRLAGRGDSCRCFVERRAEFSRRTLYSAVRIA